MKDNTHRPGDYSSGYLIVDNRSAAGELVTITAMPSQYYELTELTILNGSNEISYERNENIITFIMPECDVIIVCEFDLIT